jgi:hypothetical protein
VALQVQLTLRNWLEGPAGLEGAGLNAGGSLLRQIRLGRMRCDYGGKKGSDNVWYGIMNARGRVNERIVVDILIRRYYGSNSNEEVETKASRSVGRVVLTLRQAPIRHLVMTHQKLINKNSGVTRDTLVRYQLNFVLLSNFVLRL